MILLLFLFYQRTIFGVYTMGTVELGQFDQGLTEFEPPDPEPTEGEYDDEDDAEVLEGEGLEEE